MRTAWRLVQEWVDIQATMIDLNQVDAAEVFMPYMIVGRNGGTLYDAAIASGKYGKFLQIEAP